MCLRWDQLSMLWEFKQDGFRCDFFNIWGLFWANCRSKAAFTPNTTTTCHASSLHSKSMCRRGLMLYRASSRQHHGLSRENFQRLKRQIAQTGTANQNGEHHSAMCWCRKFMVLKLLQTIAKQMNKMKMITMMTMIIIISSKWAAFSPKYRRNQLSSKRGSCRRWWSSLSSHRLRRPAAANSPLKVESSYSGCRNHCRQQKMRAGFERRGNECLSPSVWTARDKTCEPTRLSLSRDKGRSCHVRCERLPTVFWQLGYSF